VRPSAAVCVRMPEVPVTVTVKPPGVAVLVAAKVSVLVPAPAMVAGVKAAVTPLGKPIADKLTVPTNPFREVTVMVLVPLEPCGTLTLFGEAANPKSGAGITVRLTVVVLVKLPESPVMVTVTIPVVAVPLAESVNVLVVEVLAGLNDAVTPLGKPEADKLTLPANPFRGATEMELAPLDPWRKLILFGEALSAKSGAAFTVRLIVAVCVRLPELPVTVTVKPPVVAELLAVRVSVLVPEVIAGGAKTAVTPLGKPEADKLTLPANPFKGLTVMVLAPLDPWMKLALFGEALRPKSAAEFTVRLIVAVCVRLPELPVTVTVKPPVVAVLLADRVSVLVPEVVAGGAKTAVTPLGKPEVDKLTLPAKPFWGVTVMVLAPLDPWMKLTLFGEALNAKSGPEFTVRLIVAVLVRLPELPVMVTVTVPAVAVLLAESVNVLEVEVLAGLNEAVTPAGRPDADKLTLAEKPPWGTTAMALLPLAPCTRVRLFGEAVRVKP
jgi:hypothetical protein